jgi:hypothetical protein
MTFFNRPIFLRHLFILALTFSFTTVVLAQEDNITQEKKEKKAKSSFKAFAGVNLNNLSLDSADGIDSNAKVGYNLGLSYKRGRFFYYEVGARFNQRNFEVADASNSGGTGQSESQFSVSAIEVPLTAGINITSFADRLIGVRVFLGAVPSFSVGKDVDELDLEKDDISNFIFYGQGGVGIDIVFFFIEIGYNYGFSNVVKDMNNESIMSNPSQGYFNLGFRF